MKVMMSAKRRSAVKLRIMILHLQDTQRMEM